MVREFIRILARLHIKVRYKAQYDQAHPSAPQGKKSIICSSFIVFTLLLSFPVYCHLFFLHVVKLALTSSLKLSLSVHMVTTIIQPHQSFLFCRSITVFPFGGTILRTFFHSCGSSSGSCRYVLFERSFLIDVHKVIILFLKSRAT